MDSREARQLKDGGAPPPPIWSSLSVLAVALAAGFILARLEAGPRYDWLLLMTAMGLTAAVLMRVLADNAAERDAAEKYAGDPLRDMLDSAGTMVISIGLDGKLRYMNPAAERLLGYHAAELVEQETADKLMAPGEEERLVSEVRRIYSVSKPAEGEQPGGLANYAEVVQSLAPSQVPSFETHLRRKDGSLFPARLHISTLRNRDGVPIGLVAVALDQTAATGHGEGIRIPRDRYRDLFENSSEMIATLDMTGKFLYANPAWRQTFRLDRNASLDNESFSDVFGPSCREDAMALLKKARDGVTVDRAPLRTEVADGRVLDLELSLHQRRRAGKPLAIQCLLHDVTQQKQREHRLALQLVVSQIVGENVSAEVATKRVLEALCISQGWDVAVKWDVNHEENRLEFSTAWGVQGKSVEGLIQQSMGLHMAPGESLAGRAWKEGRLVWAADLSSQSSPRVQEAIRCKMVSGWAAPVQVGNQVLAVLEFYCHMRLREDRETTAAMETVAGSLAQMLARTRERERAEELSRQQEILLGSVADGICGIDRNGLVRFANPAAARLLGARPQNLIGKPVHQLVHGSAPPDKKCGEDCPLRRAPGQRKSVTGEGTIFRSNGTSFPAEFFLNPILDQGRFSGSVLSFRDISQRYALDRMKDEFVSTVSHELRTPLTSIRGALGLLSSGMLGVINEKAANLLRIALSNSERLVRLINDILDLERTQSGREPLTFKPIQLGEIVRQAIDGVQPMADEAGVLLIHDKTQVEVTADPDRLLQVVTNLLSNAIKFSPPNSAISVMLRSGASGVTLSVIDQGRGIPADKLEAIFGRFQQVDASDSRQKGGSGLGLAICRAIVLQHSGRIWAERNPVRGSTFRVFLPYQPSAAAKSTDGDTNPAVHGAVLVADTNGTTRPLIADELARSGYRIVEATTVDQAVAVAHDGVSAIVLDTTLDGINGWEILPMLRREEPEAHTPVVLLGIANPKHPANRTPKADRLFPRPADDDLLNELVKVLCVPGEQARFLVVEDDRDLGQVIGEIFAREHITVRVAHTRQAALDECLTFQPHMIILDIGMPDGDGFNVVEWLRQHEDLNRVPLVAYSAHGLTQAERMQLVLGLGHFLAKASVEPEQLETLVLTMLRSSQEMEETMPEVSAGQGT